MTATKQHPRITRLERELAAAKKSYERLALIRELAKAKRIYA